MKQLVDNPTYKTVYRTVRKYGKDFKEPIPYSQAIHIEEQFYGPLGEHLIKSCEESEHYGWHFKSKPDGNIDRNIGCLQEFNEETRLHILSKLAFQIGDHLALPNGQPAIIKDLQIEKRIGRIQPDVLVTSSKGNKLGIEIYNTNEKSLEHSAKYRHEVIPCIEVSVKHIQIDNLTDQQAIQHIRHELFTKKVPVRFVYETGQSTDLKRLYSHICLDYKLQRHQWNQQIKENHDEDTRIRKKLSNCQAVAENILPRNIRSFEREGEAIQRNIDRLEREGIEIIRAINLIRRNLTAMEDRRTGILTAMEERREELDRAEFEIRRKENLLEGFRRQNRNYQDRLR